MVDKSGQISRRDVLISAGAAAFSPWTFWRQTGATKPVGWAVLGLGGYATGLIMPAFKSCQQSKLVALISGHPEKLTRFGDQYEIPKASRYTYDTMDEIRHNSEIDVVYVITPPSTHPMFTIRAAGLGKHVCSEKPMAPSVGDCQRMIDACRKAGRLLQIGYRCQYESHNLAAIKALRSGDLGTITSYRSDHGFNIPDGLWRTQKALAGGGSMMDIGIYSLNALRYLTGEEPILVSAKITNPPNDHRFLDVEDNVDFSLTFPSGAIGVGTSGYSWVQGKNRYEVVGEKGTLLAEPATPYGGHHFTINGKDMEVTPNNQWAAQMDHMSEHTRTGKQVLTPGEEGLRDIRIIQAVYESAKLNKPVRLRA